MLPTATSGLAGPVGFRLDMVRFYAECLAQHGHQITADHLVMPASPYVADSREQAIKEAGPYTPTSTRRYLATATSARQSANNSRAI